MAKAKAKSVARSQNERELNKLLKEHEPAPIDASELDSDEYRNQLAARLNFYTLEVDIQEKPREWLVEYVKTWNSELARRISNQNAQRVMSTYGWLARMVNTGTKLSDRDKERLDEYAQSFAKREQEEEPEEKPTKKEESKPQTPKPIEMDLPNAVLWLERIEQEIDRYLAAGIGKLNPKIVQDIQLNNRDIKYIQQELATMREQVFMGALKEDGSPDKNVIDIKPTNVRKVYEFIDNFAAQMKPQRKAPVRRKKKQQDPAKLVAKLKYKHENEDLQSVDPQRLIGASMAAVFDAKTRDLYVIYGDEGGLTVQGTTIKNVKQAWKKKVRKNWLGMVKAETTTPKRAEAFMKKLNGKASEATTRMNEDRLILSAK